MLYHQHQKKPQVVFCCRIFTAFSFVILIFSTQAQSTECKNIFSIFSFKHAVKDTESTSDDSMGTAAGSVNLPEAKREKKNEIVSCKILINAPVEVVWQTVHVERDSAPDLISNKFIEGTGNHSTFEQKWTVVPFISKTSCVIDETDVPFSRIDYRLLKSDEFKVMQGSWLFSPSENGSGTLLELTAHLETRRPAPRSFINAVAKRKMAKRLAHVKSIAEEAPAQIKVKARVL